MHEILQHDKFIIMASKTLWEHMGPEMAIEAAIEDEYREYGDCAEAIIDKLNEIAQNDEVILDDVTVLVSQLN